MLILFCAIYFLHEGSAGWQVSQVAREIKIKANLGIYEVVVEADFGNKYFELFHVNMPSISCMVKVDYQYFSNNEHTIQDGLLLKFYGVYFNRRPRADQNQQDLVR